MPNLRVGSFLVDEMTYQYIVTALWAETVSLPVAEDELNDDGCMDCDEDDALYGVVDGDPYDSHFGLDDCSDEFVQSAIDDCAEFRRKCEGYDRDGESLWDQLTDYARDEGQIGHDFWLTRNGHGAGFWDGDYEDEIGQEDSAGDAATEVAKEFGEINLWATEEGRVDLM